MGAIVRIEDPKTRRWTRNEYCKLADEGFFDRQRVELVDGEIIVMSPQNTSHSYSLDKLADILRDAFGRGYRVRIQFPLHLRDCAPEPDLFVVKGTVDDFLKDHPSHAELVVEVSGSSLNYDRTRKAALYASGGIKDYWIVNFFDRQIEVHREPRQLPKKIWKYERIEILREGATVSPLSKPTLKIDVCELLPPQK